MEDWKSKLSGLLSEKDKEKLELEQKEQEENALLAHEKLICGIEKKGRGGKTVTKVKGFTTFYTKEIEELAKVLRKKCGVGGKVENNEILLQGDQRDVLVKHLSDEGYHIVRAGG